LRRFANTRVRPRITGEEIRTDSVTRVPLDASWLGVLSRKGFCVNETNPTAAITPEARLARIISAESPSVALRLHGVGFDRSPGDVAGESKSVMVCSVSIIHEVRSVNEAEMLAAVQTMGSRHRTFLRLKSQLGG